MQPPFQLTKAVILVKLKQGVTGPRLLLSNAMPAKNARHILCR